LFHGPPEFFPDAVGAGFIRIWKDDREFLPSIAGDQVRSADFLDNEIRQLPEYLVSDQMPPPVVDFF
jgi:hypothetical protein